jgi:flagellar secretion chaperone FliS
MYQTYADTQYRKSHVLTASRGQLLVMAYDGMLRFIRLAEIAMGRKDYSEQHENIIKIQAILCELMGSLDYTANSNLADALERLYRYFYDRLTEANVYDKIDALKEVENHLHELREAWVEAESLCAQGQGGLI